MFKEIRQLFYTRAGNNKKFKILGLTILKLDKDANRRYGRFLGIKFSKKIYSANFASNRVSNVPKDPEFTNLNGIFRPNEYLLLNPDVANAKIAPLVHYKGSGYKEGRAISIADLKKPNFPEKSQEIKKVFSERQSFNKNKVSVFATFSGNGKIEDYDISLLKGLNEISDYVIFVADNPILPEELDKIKNLCNTCLFERHKEYDFGSYKRGYYYLKENNILTDNDDLVFLNDSNYGPVYPFSEVIDDYNQKDCDFYGLSISTVPKNYVQSFFYIFKSKVYNSEAFIGFINSIKRELSPGNVVFKYEIQFTEFLNKAGFKYSSYVPIEKFEKDINKHNIIPTKWTHTLMKNYRFPLVKIKALQGSTAEQPEDILEFVKQENPELYNIILPHIEKRRDSVLNREYKQINKYTLFNEYNQSLNNIKLRIKNNEKVRVVFLINITSMFPAENLLNKMLEDNLFDVRLVVTPDCRFGKDEEISMLKNTYNELKEKYPFVEMAVELDENDEIIEFYDVVKDADIVCYPSPYDSASYSLYDPSYAAQNAILSIHINYGFFRSKYDRLIYSTDNYNNFWKVFLETDLNLKEYKIFGQNKTINAVVTGYSKMDSFNNPNIVKSKKKTIIIAPHHSVANACNDFLALSNFERYSDFFLEIPKKFPQIDFIFRPHPVLFKVLKRKERWGEEKVADYLDKMLANDNVTYSTEGNYLDIFAKSDGIIQDCGSFLVEYFYTKNPCCYMLKKPDDIEAKFSDLGKQCLEHCYVAYEQESILNYLEDVIIKGNDYKKEKREKFADEVVMVNFPQATDNIIKHLKEEFEAC